MATADLRSEIKKLLLELCSTVFFGNTPASAAEIFPRLVFSLEELAFEDSCSLQELEVDVIDYGENTAPAELLADQIQDWLDHRHILTGSVLASVYRERRQPLSEDDKLMIRRRLTFQVRLYERR